MIRSLLARLSRIPPALPRMRPGRVAVFIRRFFGRGFSAAGLVFLVCLGLVAATADLIASSSPIACSLDGRVYLLPAVTRPPNLELWPNEDVVRAVDQPGEWALLPPVPYGPLQMKVGGRVEPLRPPSTAHLLGTDDKGRDVAARIIHGARSALVVGLGSVALYLLVAILLGAVAGYFGGLFDRVALRLIETMSSFPTFFLILAVQGLLGATSLLQLILVIGLTRWTDVARLTRAEVLRIVNEDYVLAARSLGLGSFTVLLRHVLPSALGPTFVAAHFGVAGAILIESTLSFLGFGVPSTTTSWGQILTDAFNNDGCYWLVLFPGVVLLLTIVAINLVGEGLREAQESL